MLDQETRPRPEFHAARKAAAGITAFAALEIQIIDSRQSEWGEQRKPAMVLWHSLQGECLTTTAKHVSDDQETPDAVHIKVGSRP